MRICGGIIFLLGTIGLGFFQASEYEKSIDIRKQAVEMLRYLMNQIRVEAATIPESICKVSVRLSGIFGEILGNIQERNNVCDGKPLFEIWQEEMERISDFFNEKDKELLVRLFDQTGFYDTKMQEKRIRMCMDTFLEEIRELEENRKKRCQLYQSMGVMVGIFVIILLW